LDQLAPSGLFDAIAVVTGVQQSRSAAALTVAY